MKNKRYTDKELQKDELLAIIASNLELDATRKKQMESAYKAVNDVLSGDEDFFTNYTINVYAQGSLLIGTTIKPLKDQEFDLDIVVHIEDSYLNHTPSAIYDELYRVLSNHKTYAPLLVKKNRCVRINYNSDFHMDILPGCMITKNNNRLMIPENGLRVSWSRTNPKDYAAWFKDISERNSPAFLLRERYDKLMLKAEIQTEDLPLQIYLKTPLQSTVQIIKRFRDIYYSDKDAPPVSSIVLTTLLAQTYNDSLSIQEALQNAMRKLKELADNYKNNKVKFSVFNPVDDHQDKAKRENFTDSWKEVNYNSFVGFVEDLEKKWNAFIANTTDEVNYKNLFGNGFHKENIQMLVKLEERFNGVDKLGLLLAGNALTNASGTINSSSGVKNVSHGFYAEP